MTSYAATTDKPAHVLQEVPWYRHPSTSRHLRPTVPKAGAQKKHNFQGSPEAYGLEGAASHVVQARLSRP